MACALMGFHGHLNIVRYRLSLAYKSITGMVVLVGAGRTLLFFQILLSSFSRPFHFLAAGTISHHVINCNVPLAFYNPSHEAIRGYRFRKHQIPGRLVPHAYFKQFLEGQSQCSNDIYCFWRRSNLVHGATAFFHRPHPETHARAKYPCSWDCCYIYVAGNGTIEVVWCQVGDLGHGNDG